MTRDTEQIEAEVGPAAAALARRRGYRRTYPSTRGLYVGGREVTDILHRLETDSERSEGFAELYGLGRAFAHASLGSEVRYREDGKTWSLGVITSYDHTERPGDLSCTTIRFKREAQAVFCCEGQRRFGECIHA